VRIAPLAFCVDPTQADAWRLIRDVCRITHHSDEAAVGALAVVLSIRSRLATPGADLSLTSLATQLPDTSVRDRLLAYDALPAEISLGEVAERYGASGYVADSVPLALLAAKRFIGADFAQMLTEIISAGGDIDSNAALAGQVFGTACGLAGPPRDLVDRLPE